MGSTKFIASLNLLVIFSISTQAQSLATITAESGSRAADQANCWSFGTFTPSSTVVINGNYSYRGNAATSQSLGACYLIAPWCKFPNTGNIVLNINQFILFLYFSRFNHLSTIQLWILVMLF